MTKKVNLELSPEEALLVIQITERVHVRLIEVGFHGYSFNDIKEAITLCHLNGCPLRLKYMKEQKEEVVLLLDVLDICDHVDRQTGKLKDQFWPWSADHDQMAFD